MKKFHPEIIRVKLTPEQAVLTCCDSGARGETYTSQQCLGGPGCPSASVGNAISS